MDFERLDKVLKERGISRRTLAQAVGIKESSLSMAFKRKSGLTDEDLAKIANYLDLSPFYLDGWSVTLEDDNNSDFTRTAKLFKNGRYMGAITIFEGDTKHMAVHDFLFFNPGIENLIRTEDQARELLSAFDQLNSTGKDEAIKRVGELTEIPRYTKPDDPNDDQT